MRATGSASGSGRGRSPSGGAATTSAGSGCAGARSASAATEVLWSIDPARHGEGFAAEAAGAALAFAADLELDEVFAMILPVNAASLRVAEKIGMTRHGKVEHAGFDHLLFRAAPT
jgi:L-amino acid N-acyltransferase YncA